MVLTIVEGGLCALLQPLTLLLPAATGLIALREVRASKATGSTLVVAAFLSFAVPCRVHMKAFQLQGSVTNCR